MRCWRMNLHLSITRLSKNNRCCRLSWMLMAAMLLTWAPQVLELLRIQTKHHGHSRRCQCHNCHRRHPPLPVATALHISLLLLLLLLIIILLSAVHHHHCITTQPCLHHNRNNNTTEKHLRRHTTTKTHPCTALLRHHRLMHRQLNRAAQQAHKNHHANASQPTHADTD